MVCGLSNPLGSRRGASALDDVADSTEFEVIVKRRNGISCGSKTYDLTVE